MNPFNITDVPKQWLTWTPNSPNVNRPPISITGKHNHRRYSKFVCILAMLMCVLGVAYSRENKMTSHHLNDLNTLRSLQEFDATRGGAYISVGGDPNGCDYDNIQEALNAAVAGNISEIRIAKNLNYTENLVIDEMNLLMVGGYDDCFAMGLPFSLGDPGFNRAQISGSAANLPVIQVTGDGQRNTVILKNLTLTNGSGSTFINGGGLSTLGANVQILLEKVTIRNNSSRVGGGMAIQSGNTDVHMIDTVIQQNSAEIGGGGIYCAGTDTSVAVDRGSGVILNQTSSSQSNGGGIHVSNGCTLSLYSAEVNANQTPTNGGGIYARDRATVVMVGYQLCVNETCLGDNERHVRLNNNQADSNLSGAGSGGAIYAENNSTFVSMAQVWIDDNTAHNGGAISVNDGADVLMLRSAKTCSIRPFNRCNLIDANLARGFGGAIYNNEGLIDASQYNFRNNRADLGTAIYALSKTSFTRVSGGQFIRNGNNGFKGVLTDFDDVYVIRSLNALIELKHTTFADNRAVDAVFGISNTESSFLFLINSIIWDESSQLVLDGPSEFTFINCVLAHENLSFTGTQVSLEDPQFKDVKVSDYHINPLTSPAVDFCTDSSGVAFIDMDGERGGWDDPDRANFNNDPLSVFDAGADESQSSDLLFKDGHDPIIDP